LNKDEQTVRTIRVQTGFPPHTRLKDFSGHEGTVATDGASNVTITIPSNQNGRGYVCYSLPETPGPFPVTSIAAIQDYEGAGDLDIKPALVGSPVTVCRVFVDAKKDIDGELFFDASHWTANSSIELQLLEPGGTVAAQRVYKSTTPQGSALSFQAKQKGFHEFRIQSANTPAQNQTPTYKLRVKYTAPQTL
jgi:hypothetical protein